uniref:tRNA methyltransferase 10 homolog B n=1 Tax=Schistocephalus solidus TaxID=70667 RepID=A0A0X3PCS8_SCHSO
MRNIAGTEKRLAARRLKRKDEKRRRRERDALITRESVKAGKYVPKRTVVRHSRERMIENLMNAPKICIDCSFESLMSPKVASRLCLYTALHFTRNAASSRNNFAVPTALIRAPQSPSVFILPTFLWKVLLVSVAARSARDLKTTRLDFTHYRRPWRSPPLNWSTFHPMLSHPFWILKQTLFT